MLCGGRRPERSRTKHRCTDGAHQSLSWLARLSPGHQPLWLSLMRSINSQPSALFPSQTSRSAAAPRHLPTKTLFVGNVVKNRGKKSVPSGYWSVWRGLCLQPCWRSKPPPVAAGHPQILCHTAGWALQTQVFVFEWPCLTRAPFTGRLQGFKKY